MSDVHNTVAEQLPHDELIRRYFAHLRHVHLNEMDGRHPGALRCEGESVVVPRKVEDYLN